jgi:hypothetical protein
MRIGLKLAIALAVTSLCASGHAAAQQVRPAGMPGDTTLLNPLQQSYKDAMVELRDTLTVLASDMSLFRQDLAGAGAETVLSRAELLHGSCGNSVDLLRAAEPVFRPSRAPNDRVRTQSEALLSEMRALRRTLDEQCLTGLALEGPGERADTLRAWGPYRLRGVGLAIQAYYATAGEFQKAAEFKVEPRLPR